MKMKSIESRIVTNNLTLPSRVNGEGLEVFVNQSELMVWVRFYTEGQANSCNNASFNKKLNGFNAPEFLIF